MNDFTYLLPEWSKPHEAAILFFYIHIGITSPKQIADVLHYKSPHTVYKVLKKYRKEVLTVPNLIVESAE